MSRCGEPSQSPQRSSVTDEIDRICDEFEEAWRRAGPAGDPRIESWAQRVEPSQRDNLLAELLQTELELRQEQGDVLRLEEYRARFPDWSERVETIFRRVVKYRRLGKYELQAELGHGGMGVVYRAYDREQNEVVAIKTLRPLHGLDGDAIYRLRNEFRARADLVHPNLVNLYELFAEEDRWFFTMELVRGVDFLEYVRAGWSEGTPARSHAAHFGPDADSAAEGDSGALNLRTQVPQTTLAQAPPTAPIPGEARQETLSYGLSPPDSLAPARGLAAVGRGDRGLARAPGCCTATSSPPTCW